MRAHPFYRQATLFEERTRTLPAVLTETIRRLMAVQQGANALLKHQIERMFVEPDREQRQRNARGDALCNYAGLMAAMVASTNIETLRIGKPSDDATLWESKSVADLCFYAYGQERSKRCAERHLARAKAAGVFGDAPCKDTRPNGDIRSENSLRWMTDRIFRVCGTLAMLKAARKQKQRERAEKVAKDAAARHQKYRSKPRRERGSQPQSMAEIATVQFGMPDPKETPASAQAPPEETVDANRSDLLAYLQAKGRDALGDD